MKSRLDKRSALSASLRPYEEADLTFPSHWQVVEDGYEFFAKRQLVTLFSAPNYCGEFDNAAAMMIVDENLLCSFEILRPSAKVKAPVAAAACCPRRSRSRRSCPGHSGCLGPNLPISSQHPKNSPINKTKLSLSCHPTTTE